MKDAVSILRIAQLHPAVRAAFQKFIEDCEAAYDITIRIVQGMRTFEEQHAIFLKGPAFTKADAGKSYHNYGLAIDIGVLANGKIDWSYDYKKFQQFMPSSMIWGADWDHDGKTKADGDKDEHLVDGDHYEITLGHNWRDLLVKHSAKDFISGTQYVNIR